ncbi:MAG TPA: serine/threonine-protein kinase [Pirellulales bacterium]|nr:serine/threonine-protein kinase [Pirellulales bacterium]
MTSGVPESRSPNGPPPSANAPEHDPYGHDPYGTVPGSESASSCHDTIPSLPGDAGIGELLPERASDVLALVGRQVRLFADAWKTSVAPSPADFVPEAAPSVRRLLLLELVKVDLNRRWRRPELRRQVEDYLQLFPELVSDGKLPYDLVVEEYQARRQHGEVVVVQEYERRFASHAQQIKRLLLDADRAPSTALAPATSLDELDAGQQIDDFDLILRVGQGAFGRVFLARQRSMQRLVALKVSADRSNEPQTMAQLDHPHIVRVFDQRLVKERDLRLLYMQYVAGGTLQNVISYLRLLPEAERTGAVLFEAIDQCLTARGESTVSDSPQRQRLSGRTWPEVVCWLGIRLASALDYAHRRNVLHRDLKPANVLVAADGNPKLADFNISYCSKVEGSTPAAYFGGSLPYMSPEQLEAFNPANERPPGDVDGRSDLYSLGVLLWELLTGERPFHDPPVGSCWTTALDEMVARRREPLARALPLNLPTGLEETLRRCLAADREERFASPGHLARQLEICLQPRAQRLLLPRPGWRSLAQRFAVTALLIAGLTPNVFASALSIVFNQVTIISELTPEAQQVFKLQLAVINPIAYSLAVTWLLWLAWPIVRGVYRRRIGQGEPPAERAEERRRCLRIGEYVAWVSTFAYIVCGVAFLLWLKLDQRTERGMAPDKYAAFFTALVVCGLMAATLSFFCVTFVAVRALYPRLVDADANDATAARELAGLARRSGLYFLAAVSVPFIAVLAVVALLEGDDKYAVIALGLIGLATFFASYRLWREIQHDLDALTALADPTAALGEASSLAGDSSWSSLR